MPPKSTQPQQVKARDGKRCSSGHGSSSSAAQKKADDQKPQKPEEVPPKDLDAALEARKEELQAYEEQWHNDVGPQSDAQGNVKRMPLLVQDKYAKVEIPELAEFDPSLIMPDGTVVAIGKRRTGKSWAFRHIMYVMRNQFYGGIVISQTDELNGFWRQYIPEKYIFNKFSPAILQAVFDRQKAIMKDTSKSEAEREKQARFFILLDDVISDPNIRYDPSITELFVAGRHYKLFVLITTQYAKAITPTLRSNADYVLMLHNKQESQREALWRDFADFVRAKPLPVVCC